METSITSLLALAFAAVVTIILFQFVFIRWLLQAIDKRDARVQAEQANALRRTADRNKAALAEFEQTLAGVRSKAAEVREWNTLSRALREATLENLLAEVSEQLREIRFELDSQPARSAAGQHLSRTQGAAGSQNASGFAGTPGSTSNHSPD